MSPLQKQAVLVCVICALAALLTVGITLTLLKKGKAVEEPAPSTSDSTTEDPTAGDDLSNRYQINTASAALLTETEDAEEGYLNDTLFLGDSNTVRLYNNGLISLQQFCAKEGIGTQAALSDGIVTFKGDNNRYTIAEAVAKMKPRRVVMTFGTNDTGMEVNEFITHYTALVQTIQASYPYTDIIVNTVPPIPADHSTYPHMDQAKIDDFNMALLNMCEQLGLKFLNSAEVLKGADGYGNADYYTSGDIHLKTVGLKAVLNYIRTHAYNTEDRRPDTAGIPTRTLEYVSNPSSAVAAPSSSEETASSESVSSSASESESSSESKETAAQYEVRYQVEKSGGGSLSCGGDSGKSLSYKINDPSKSLTVTAVPAEGHVFVKWSDGETSKTRTDTNFKQNLDVTAVFASLSVRITGEKSFSGNSITFRANVSGKYGSSDSIRWYANGVEVKEAAGHATVTVQITDTSDATYKVHAVVTYNDCPVTSNTLTINVVGSSTSSSSSSSSSSGSSSSGSSSSTSSSGASSGSTSSSSSSSSSSESSSGASSSHSTSGSADSTSHSSSASASSKSEASSESKAESKSESKSESTSESKAETSGSSEKPASSENDASSNSSAKTEESASTSKAD